jgi:hypothetical protein
VCGEGGGRGRERSTAIGYFFYQLVRCPFLASRPPPAAPGRDVRPIPRHPPQKVVRVVLPSFQGAIGTLLRLRLAATVAAVLGQRQDVANRLPKIFADFVSGCLTRWRYSHMIKAVTDAGHTNTQRGTRWNCSTD